MPWVSDTEYVYTPGVLDCIASSYDSIYSVIEIGTHEITSLDRLIEYKADFDIALDSIGKGHWDGLNESDFRAYSGFGRLQRIVIAKILGISDWELMPYGFFMVSQGRGTAYFRMCETLNGQNHTNQAPRNHP